MEPAQQQKLTKELFHILKTLDVDAALKSVAAKGFIPDTRDIALAGLHKARLRTRRVWSRKELNDSRTWLLENGYKLP